MNTDLQQALEIIRDLKWNIDNDIPIMCGSPKHIRITQFYGEMIAKYPNIRKSLKILAA